MFDDTLRKMRDSERKVVENGQEIERIREDEEATSPPLVEAQPLPPALED